MYGLQHALKCIRESKFRSTKGLLLYCLLPASSHSHWTVMMLYCQRLLRRTIFGSPCCAQSCRHLPNLMPVRLLCVEPWRCLIHLVIRGQLHSRSCSWRAFSKDQFIIAGQQKRWKWLVRDYTIRSGWQTWGLWKCSWSQLLQWPTDSVS